LQEITQAMAENLFQENVYLKEKQVNIVYKKYLTMRVAGNITVENNSITFSQLSQLLYFIA
jgi:hypothetical protein